MSQPTWEAYPQGKGWVVVHTPSGLRVGKCLGQEEAVHLSSALRAMLPHLDMETVTTQHASMVRALLEASMKLRPNITMKQYTVTVAITVPVWADSAAEAHTLFQSMADNEELYSYANEFAPEVSVAEILERGYEDPSYAVTSDGLEEVGRLPYVPTYAPTNVIGN